LTSILHDLNAEQRAAVLHPGGPLLLLAGAGSGKTRVITRRIAHLMLERGIDPLRVIAITFTNKAAREMRERVTQLVPRSDLWVSTFHSAAARILRREATALGLSPDFTIYDTYDRGQCLKTVIRELELDDSKYKAGPIGHRISSRKNRGLAPGERDIEGVHDENFLKIERAYAERMAKSAALDFDDLLLKLLEVFEKHKEVGEKYARRFEHVLVDEYQDTNAVQYRITKHLAAVHRNLTVCGDPDQSIYGWRGADLRNILDFERDFAPATVLRLEQNYRSTKNILDAAQAVIEHNTLRKQKNLKTEAAPGAKLIEMESIDELDEAHGIVRKIRELGRGPGGGRAYRANEIAIFYRANFLQRALEKALRDAGVPYRIAAGLEFFERREIKDVLAYLRLLANPRDDVSFERIVNVPSRGIGDATVYKLREEAQRLGLPLLETMSRSHVRAGFPAKARSSMEQFLRIVDDLRQFVDGPAELALQAVLDATKYVEYCGDLEDGGDEERVSNVRELVASAAEYDTREPQGFVRGYLSEVSLVSDTDRLEEGVERVTLMTLHSAKGLEFPAVFIAGLEEGLMPHRRAVEERAGGEGLEEERRLLYVGITRARERLFLSYARYRSQFGIYGTGDSERGGRSRFLDEIPPMLLLREHRERLPERDAWDESQEREEAPSVSRSISAPSASYSPKAAPSSTGGSNKTVGGLGPGDVVLHAHFGVGKIVEITGAGPNAKAVVQFRGAGTKQLLLQYANLEKVSQTP